MILKAHSRFSSKSPFMASACISSNSISLSKVQISTFSNGSPRNQGLHDSPPRHSFSPSPAFNARKFSSEKKSFAVVAGELFIGMATRLFKPRKLLGNRAGFVVNRNVELRKRRRCSPNGEGRIGAQVEDPCDSGIIWEQREKDVIAEKEQTTLTSTGFSFSAAGLMFPYHLGVAQFLIEKGYITENTPLAGASAGSIVCAAIASGISMKDALNATKLLAEDCRLKGTAFRIGAVLREFLVKFLPDDVHVRSNGRVRVAVTQILWRPRGLLVDQFDSKEDFINAVFASSFIPGYLAPRPATIFRNKLCVDGGLTLFMPPTSASRTVKVCAFPASRLGLRGIGISPDCNPKNRATPREFFSWALEPADDIVLDQLFECGYRDAAVWSGKNPVESLVAVQSDCVEDVHLYGRCIGMDACSKSQALNDANMNSETTLSANLCIG